MQLHFVNKHVLVTGASQGIGKEIAMQFASEGAKLLLVSNDQNGLDDVTNEINVKGGLATNVCCDLSVESDLDKIVEKVAVYFDYIDILVNNVGGIGRLANFENFTSGEWLQIFNLNVLSSVMLTKLLLPKMKQRQYGRIIFIASEKASEPGTMLAPYAMSKAAVVSVAKSLANELGKDGITVNCVSPGVILTPAWDANAATANLTREAYAAQFCQNVISKEQLGMPVDVATLVCYLCSDQARWMTGGNYRVDGGSIKSIQL